MSGRNLYNTRSNLVFNIFLYVIMIFIGAITLFPFLNVLAISLNHPLDTVKGGIFLFPRVFTLESYKKVFSISTLLDDVKISVLRTVIGTACTVFFTTMLAYAISRRDFIARKPVTILFVITLYVNGGLIPNFLLIKSLGQLNRFDVYIIPNLVAVWSVFVVRSFIDNLPVSFQESARLDGANDFVILIRVIMPLSMPVIATIALFAAVGQWNSWYDTYIYCSSNQKLSTLQYEMMKILQSTNNIRSLVLSGNTTQAAEAAHAISPESIRMTITIIATLPIILVYPFLQKYFVKGLIIGGVKG